MDQTKTEMSGGNTMCHQVLFS